MDGKGMYWFNNGNTYEGQWRQGLMEGYGIMKYTTGEIYEGDWRNGIQSKFFISLFHVVYLRELSIYICIIDGKGKVVQASGRYEGDFKEGQKDGQVSEIYLL